MKRRKIVNIFIVLIIFLFICMLSTPVFASSLELDERKNIVDTNNINKIKFKDKFLVNELSYQCDILEEIEDKNLNDYEETFSFLINEIKQMDENFNINDYKVTSHFYNKNDKNGFIKFTYYINGNIETNKVYIAKY